MYVQLLGNADWLTLILLAILFTPVVGFLWYESKVRRTEILGSFTPTGIKRYFEMFLRQEWAAITKDGKPGGEQLVSEFMKSYDARFGIRRYLVPAILLVASAGATLYLALLGPVAWLESATAIKMLPSIGVAAVAGAYLSIVTELIVRHRARDLWPRDLLLAALRMALAVPLGYAFSALAAEAAGLPIAFMIGAFPIKTLIAMSRRLAARKLSLGEEAVTPEGAGSRELEKLQGVRGAIAERLDDENVTTILQLAYTDPLELTIRTGYSFTYILDCVSQALAWIYLEDRLQDLRVLSIRGACEIGNLFDWSKKDEPKLNNKETALVKAIAEKLKVGVEVCERMLLEIAADPHAMFIADVWQPGAED